MGPARARSAAKAFSWRIVATVTTIVLVYSFTGQLELAIAVGGVETVTKLFLYYLHERLWAHTAWRRDVSDE